MDTEIPGDVRRYVRPRDPAGIDDDRPVRKRGGPTVWDNVLVWGTLAFVAIVALVYWR